MVFDRAKVCNSLRHLVKSTWGAGDHTTCLFFADKLTTMEKRPEDYLVLCRLYLENNMSERLIRLILDGKLARGDTFLAMEFRLVLARAYALMGEWDTCREVLESVLATSDLHSQEKPPAFPATEGHPFLALAGTRRMHGGVVDQAKRYPLKEGEEVNIVARMCCLLGKAYMELDNLEIAVMWLRRALYCDVFCAEAFLILANRSLLSESEERKLVAQMPWTRDSMWLCSVYCAWLLTNDVSTSFQQRFSSLDEYGLGDNADIAQAKAVTLYRRNDLEGALAWSAAGNAAEPSDSVGMGTGLPPPTISPQTQLNLRLPTIRGGSLPGPSVVQVACLHAMGKTNELFALAQTAKHTRPKHAFTWYTIACYYSALGKHDVARRYFSKCTRADPHLSAAWIGLGHAAASMDESEQAMASYRTAARILRGSHLPQLWMGVEASRTQNIEFGIRMLEAAGSACPVDPQVYHEHGVVLYRQGRYDEAISQFRLVADLTCYLPSHLRTHWESTFFNMGHCFRKKGEYTSAIACYQQCLTLQPQEASTFTSIGFTYHLMGDVEKAIGFYHKALSFDPDLAMAQQLLTRAMSEGWESNISAIMQDLTLEPSAGLPRPGATPKAPSAVWSRSQGSSAKKSSIGDFGLTDTDALPQGLPASLLSILFNRPGPPYNLHLSPDVSRSVGEQEDEATLSALFTGAGDTPTFKLFSVGRSHDASGLKADMESPAPGRPGHSAVTPAEGATTPDNPTGRPMGTGGLVLPEWPDSGSSPERPVQWASAHQGAADLGHNSTDSIPYRSPAPTAAPPAPDRRRPRPPSSGGSTPPAITWVPRRVGSEGRGRALFTSMHDSSGDSSGKQDDSGGQSSDNSWFGVPRGRGPVSRVGSGAARLTPVGRLNLSGLSSISSGSSTHRLSHGGGGGNTSPEGRGMGRAASWNLGRASLTPEGRGGDAGKSDDVSPDRSAILSAASLSGMNDSSDTFGSHHMQQTSTPQPGTGGAAQGAAAAAESEGTSDMDESRDSLDDATQDMFR